MIRLYHPQLGTEVDAGDDTQAAIYEDSGWVRAPEPAPARPGYQPEPVRYEQGTDGLWRPVAEPEPEPEPAKVRRTNKPSEDS